MNTEVRKIWYSAFTYAEISGGAESVFDHTPYTYIFDDEGFAISMNGHYTAEELNCARACLVEANQWYLIHRERVERNL